MNPKRTAPKQIIIKIPEVKDKERSLKAAREKQLITYKEAPIRLSVDFSKETLQDRNISLARNTQSHETGTYSQDGSTQQRYHLELKGR